MDDLISRQAAIKAITTGSLSAATVYGRTDEGMCALKEILMAIKDLPSEGTGNGHWLNLPHENGYFHKCSNCRKVSGYGSGDLWFNFCPNCGADMRGEEDEMQ